ncbi:hypothetical protein [Botrimarina mediterranea]|uniref:PEP-CTERM protein-sorting domain-containing protein n=1 Tax=Botrimarina mediterranea TaxID=2528022 RepID=A0A518K966_9BACT|nr:hypothetical protein [Botrimarina mediterranea]QDV74320.1 hypothetical protein Spa11_25220 [Botrimarina mediterranea]
MHRLAALILTLLLPIAAAAQPTFAWDGFDIYVDRPSRIDNAAPGQSIGDPVYHRSWDFSPATQRPEQRPQRDPLSASDSFALWVPLKNLTNTTDPYSHYATELPVVDGDTRTVSFDLYHRLNGFVGDAFTGPEERSYWIGNLSPGEYHVTLRHWDLPPAPEGPDPNGQPHWPWEGTLDRATLRQTDTWTVRVIPEPTTVVLATMLAGWWMMGRPPRHESSPLPSG